MTFLQALRYFLREALTGTARSLRVSVLAIFTIAVSLFLAGALFLFSQNLARTVHLWRSQARLVVYLDREATAPQRDAVRVALERGAWSEEVVEVTPAEAERRFARAFPSLAEVAASGETALPHSFEVRLRPPADSAERARVDGWTAELRDFAGVETVDADQDWIAQVETLLALVRGIGFALTGILLGASVFTIASVVRLTSFLYRDEIAIMRLVGATEFYIRGPFYCEGILQGLAGGGLAVLALLGLDRFLRGEVAASPLAGLVAERFLSPTELLLLLLFGAAAGLVGAMVSLGRESLHSANA